jgi:hypothetical protein
MNDMRLEEQDWGYSEASPEELSEESSSSSKVNGGSRISSSLAAVDFPSGVLA